MPRATHEKATIRFAGIALLLALPAASAWANVGVPLFSNLTMYAYLLLLPIIDIEARVLCGRLGVPRRPAIVAAALANGASTLAGTVIYVVLGILLGGVEYSGRVGDYAVIFALAPCWMLSVTIEVPMIVRRFPDLPRERVRTAVVIGNAATYAMFGILAGTRLLLNGP